MVYFCFRMKVILYIYFDCFYIIDNNLQFLNFHLHVVMLKGSAMINTFFTVIRLFSFRKFLMQTATTGAFRISFTVTDLQHRLTDSIKTLFTHFCNVSFDSLLDGLTRKEIQKWLKLNLILNFKKIVTINFKFICFPNFLKDQRSLQPSHFHKHLFKITILELLALRKNCLSQHWCPLQDFILTIYCIEKTPVQTYQQWKGYSEGYIYSM